MYTLLLLSLTNLNTERWPFKAGEYHQTQSNRAQTRLSVQNVKWHFNYALQSSKTAEKTVVAKEFLDLIPLSIIFFTNWSSTKSSISI